MFTASDIFDLAIQLEINGENFYRDSIGKISDQPIKDLLHFLADQEVQHRETFHQLKERLCTAEKRCDPIPNLDGSALRAAMGRHALSLDELEIPSLTGAKDLLEAAVGFEEDTVQFYEFISSLVNDPLALTAIQEIRIQELDHRDKLMRALAAM